MSNYYVRTIERAAAPRSRKLREAGTGTAVSGSSASMDTSGLVTLYTDQTITGEKTFANDVIFGGEVSEGVFGSMYLPSTEGPGKYSLYVSTDPVSGETPTAPSGIDEDELWDILGGSGTEVIDLSHIPSIPTSKITGLDTVLAPYATQAWVQQQGYLASVSLATISDLDSGWDALLKAAPSYYSKAEIGSLLSSYYTKTEADGRFVGVSNEQTVSGKKTFSSLLTAGGGISSTNADFSGYVSADVLYLPYSGGNRMYSLYVSTGPVSGEQPSEGIGLDEEAMWTALGGSMSSKVIDISHIPAIPTSKITGLDSSLASYVTTNTEQTISGLKTFARDAASVLYVENTATTSTSDYAAVVFRKAGSSIGVLAASAENNYLYRANPAFSVAYAILDAGNYTSYTVTKTGGGASGTWGIDISGNAATADVSNYLFLNPNNGTHASQNDAVPANGRFAIYDVNTATTAGGSDGYIMAFRWPSGNWATQVYLDVDNTGIMALRHRSSTNVWTDWYRILHSGNYSSYLDSRYVTLSTDQSLTGEKTSISQPWAVRMSHDTSNSVNGLVWKNTSGTRIAGLNYHNTAKRIFINANYPDITDIWSDTAGKYSLRIGWNELTYNSYPILRSDNYSSYLDSRYVKKSGDTMTGTLTAPSLYANSEARIYESASHATRLTLNWSGSIARIYAINNSGSGYHDLSLGQTPGNSGALYFDASAARWGIGTTSPAYKLDVAGTLRATNIAASSRLYVPSSQGNLVFDIYIG